VFHVVSIAEDPLQHGGVIQPWRAVAGALYYLGEGGDDRSVEYMAQSRPSDDTGSMGYPGRNLSLVLCKDAYFTACGRSTCFMTNQGPSRHNAGVCNLGILSGNCQLCDQRAIGTYNMYNI
jgi:hypothetical protein